MPKSVTEKWAEDLCPKKPNKNILDVGETRVAIEITVTAENPAPVEPKRLRQKAAAPVVDKYRKVIQKEVLLLEAKLLELKKKGGDKKVAEKMAAETTLSVQGACKALQGAINVAATEQMKLDARADQSLREAQVMVAVKIGFQVIKIGKDIAMITVTAGADLTAWASLAKNIYSLASTVNDETKSEKARRVELLEAIGKFTSETTKRRHLAEQATGSNAKKLELAYKDIFKSLAGEGKKAEAKRMQHKQKVTDMRKALNALSIRSVELAKAMKDAKDLTSGVKIGSKCMEVKKAVDINLAILLKAEKFNEDMAWLLSLQGVTSQDKLFRERMGTVKTVVPDMVKGGAEIYGAAKNVSEMVGALGTLV